MTEPWRAAELFEEIIKKANPLRALAIGGGRVDGVTRSVTVGVTDNMCAVTYSYPLDRIMAGVQGTPEELLEWLKTGLSEHERVSIDEFRGEQQLSITREWTDERLVANVRRAMTGTCERQPLVPADASDARAAE